MPGVWMPPVPTTPTMDAGSQTVGMIVVGIFLLIVLGVGLWCIYRALKQTNIDPPNWWDKPWDADEPQWPIRPESPAQLGGKHGRDGR